MYTYIYIYYVRVCVRFLGVCICNTVFLIDCTPSIAVFVASGAVAVISLPQVLLGHSEALHLQAGWGQISLGKQVKPPFGGIESCDFWPCKKANPSNNSSMLWGLIYVLKGLWTSKHSSIWQTNSDKLYMQTEKQAKTRSLKVLGRSCPPLLPLLHHHINHQKKNRFLYGTTWNISIWNPSSFGTCWFSFPQWIGSKPQSSRHRQACRLCSTAGRKPWNGKDTRLPWCAPVQPGG